MKKYKVIFYDYADEEYPIDQIFDSREEAMDFAESGMWEEEYEYIGNDGEDHFATRDRYFNKDYNESFFSYQIEEFLSELNKEFLYMQKLAGLITEEEYKARLWYKQYSENISKALDNLKQTLNNEGYNIK